MTTNVKNFLMNTGDRVLFNGTTHKVMAVKDYSYMIPQMGFSLSRWEKNITIKDIKTTLTEGEAINTYTDVSFRGLVQPLKYSELMLLPEEQRAWIWLKITTFSLCGYVDYFLVENVH